MPELLGQRPAGIPLRAHPAALGMESGDRQRDRNGTVMRVTEHDRRAALGERGGQIAGPGTAMGVEDDGVDVVERDTADFAVVVRDDHEPAIGGQVQPLRPDIDDPLHPPSRLRG